MSAVYSRANAKRESALESRAVKWARARCIVVAKLKECDGVPDRIFFLPRRGVPYVRGQALIMEFKRRGEKPEELQEWYLTKLLEDGFDVGWVDSWEGFLEAMRERGVE